MNGNKEYYLRLIELRSSAMAEEKFGPHKLTDVVKESLKFGYFEPYVSEFTRKGCS